MLPLAVFHERQALVDPMLTTFVGLAMLTMMRLARRPDVMVGALLALTLSGAILTKTSAVLFLALPVLASLLFSRRLSTFRRSLTLGTLAVAVAVGAYRLLVWRAEQSSVVPKESHLATFDNVIIPGFSNAESLPILQKNLTNIVEGIVTDVGPAVVLLAVASLLSLRRAPRRARREVLFLLVPAFVLLAPYVVLVSPAGAIPPRYLMPNALPMIVLAAFSFVLLIGYLERRNRWVPRLGGLVIAALVLLPALRFDAILICTPLNAPISDFSDDIGSQQLASALLDRWYGGNRQRFVLMNPGWEIYAIGAYLGPRLVESSWMSADNSEEMQERLAQALASGYQVVLSGTESQLSTRIDGVVMDAVGTYRSQHLFYIAGAEEPLASRVYGVLADSSPLASPYLGALPAALGTNPAVPPAIVFPASHAPLLAEHTSREVVPFPLHTWPLTATDIQFALDALTLADGSSLAAFPDGAPLDLVLVNPASTDPDNLVALAFQRGLYNTGGFSRSGDLYRTRFITGPTQPPPPTAHATFENAIHLSAALVDQHARPGGTLRLAVEWQTDIPVEDSYRVLVEVVDGTGALVARRDAPPGDGLLPITGWLPGQAIPDRFAIPLPAAMPPGDVEVRIALTHPTSGLRLRVTAGDETGPGYAVLGRAAVRQDVAP